MEACKPGFQARVWLSRALWGPRHVRQAVVDETEPAAGVVSEAAIAEAQAAAAAGAADATSSSATYSARSTPQPSPRGGEAAGAHA